MTWLLAFALTLAPPPEQNARTYYVAAAGLLVEPDRAANLIVFPPEAEAWLQPFADDPRLPAKRALVARNQAALAKLREGFAHPYVETTPARFDAAFGHLNQIRQLVRMLRLEGQVRAADGDLAGAVASGLDAVQVAVDLAGDAPLIGVLVAHACLETGLADLPWLAADLFGDEARAAARRLATLAARLPDYGQTITQEKTWVLAGLQGLFAQLGENWRGAAAMVQAPGVDLRAYVAERTQEQILDDVGLYWDQLAALGQQPYAVPLPEPATAPSPLFNLVGPQYRQARLQAHATEANLGLTIGELALRAWFEQHGAYPDTLDQLVPTILEASPRDPYSGQPLRYRRDGGRYLLWSIGPDGDDDDGRPVKTGDERPKPTDDGDLVRRPAF